MPKIIDLLFTPSIYRRLLPTLICLLVFGGICVGKEGSFRVSGRFKSSISVRGRYVYVYHNAGSKLIPADSVLVRNNGTFAVNVKIPNTDLYTLVFNRVNRIDLAPSIGDNISLQIDNTATPYIKYTLKGSSLSQETKRIYDYVTDARKRSLDIEESSYSQSDTLDYLESLTKILLELDSTNKWIRSYIKSNNIVLLNVYAASFLNIREESNETVNKLYNNVRGINTSSLYIGDFIKQIEILNRLAIGKQAPSIEAKMYKGKKFELSDYEGKTVLIYFWASWCPPARDDNPNIVKLYKKYRSKNFEVLGVSLDTDPVKWENAINADGLNFLNVSELKGWKSNCVKDYFLNGIPYNILIDTKGKILAKNVKSKELDGLLGRLLKNF